MKKEIQKIEKKNRATTGTFAAIGAVAGAIVAGPPGAAVGGAIGGYVGEKYNEQATEAVNAIKETAANIISRN